MEIGQPVNVKNVRGEFCIPATVHAILSASLLMVEFRDGRGIHTVGMGEVRPA